jgi:hypothetical protein
MNPPKCSEEDYIQWLIASPKVISCTEAARTDKRPVAHDAYTRLLERLEPDPELLWLEVESLVDLKRGQLVLDDSTLDKPYGPHIELVVRHWSGKHRAVVEGINLITLLWTDGDLAIPVDWRVFDKQRDGLTKNDHLRRMLQTARQRGFRPECVLWDSWYSSLENLKLLRSWGWPFFVGLKSNRQVNPDGEGNRAIGKVAYESQAQRTHLKGFGWVMSYRVEDGHRDPRFFISNEGQPLDQAQVQEKKEQAQQIEGYHRGLKQECHIERCQARKARKQRNHIMLALRAFVRLEWNRYLSGVGRLMMKQTIIRKAVGEYLEDPIYTLDVNPTA